VPCAGLRTSRCQAWLGRHFAAYFSLRPSERRVCFLLFIAPFKFRGCAASLKVTMPKDVLKSTVEMQWKRKVVTRTLLRHPEYKVHDPFRPERSKNTGRHSQNDYANLVANPFPERLSIRPQAQ
jgi:hypothetical protein